MKGENNSKLKSKFHNRNVSMVEKSSVLIDEVPASKLLYIAPLDILSESSSLCESQLSLFEPKRNKRGFLEQELILTEKPQFNIKKNVSPNPLPKTLKKDSELIKPTVSLPNSSIMSFNKLVYDNNQYLSQKSKLFNMDDYNNYNNTIKGKYAIRYSHSTIMANRDGSKLLSVQKK